MWIEGLDQMDKFEEMNLNDSNLKSFEENSIATTITIKQKRE